MNFLKLAELLVPAIVFAILYFNGAGVWAAIIFPYGLFEYWKGARMTKDIFYGGSK